MNGFLLTLLDMSLVSSFLILAVLFLRFVCKRAPKAIICLLWALVGIRLLCPFTFESPLSLVPESEPITYIAQKAEENDTAVKGVEKINRDVVSYDTAEGSVVVASKASPKPYGWDYVLKALPFVWAGGIAVMVVLSLVSYVKLKRSIIVSVCVGDNIWRCDGIKSPFILGIIRPRIYVPSHLNDDEVEVVVKHEKAHLRRLDHIWKPLGYLILTLHWFNPLVWIAYAMLCRDIEGACDEYVIRKMSKEDKKLYSETLLSCSVSRHLLTACPVAFGEISVKERIRSVLSYKKPALWIIITALSLSALVAVLFMTDPVTQKTSGFDTPEELIHQVILNQEENGIRNEDFICEVHEILDVEEINPTKSTYYMWVSYGEFSEDNGELNHNRGGMYPVSITVKQQDDMSYTLVEYWRASEGNLYSDSIKAEFPAHLHNRVLYGTSHLSLDDKLMKLAKEHFGIKDKAQTVGEYPRFNAEISEVYDDYYLVTPVEGEVIMGKTYDKICVYKLPENDNYIKGDIITVCYYDMMEESEPPFIYAKSISLNGKVFDRIEPYYVDFFRVYENDNMTMNVYLNVNEDELKNIEVYRFMPETPLPPENIPEGSVCMINDRFAPYILLDHSKGYANFAYSDTGTVVGIFELKDGKLTINGFPYSEYYPYVEKQSGYTYTFDFTTEGFALDKENSQHFETYRYVLDGKVYDNLPDKAVFTDGFVLKTE